MDELQARLAHLGLEVLAEYGFALAGGYALQAHHLVERMSEDIDMFTDRWDPHSFAAAVNAVSEAFRQHGLGVEVTRQAETFARLQIIDHTSGREASMDLAADYRQHQPIVLSVGPVLEETDAVATKVATVFSRALARDYLDLAGILASGRYSKERLLELAVTVDAGFTKARFAEALAAIDRFADQISRGTKWAPTGSNRSAKPSVPGAASSRTTSRPAKPNRPCRRRRIAQVQGPGSSRLRLASGDEPSCRAATVPGPLVQTSGWSNPRRVPISASNLVALTRREPGGG
jgi:Nucleotidyl transferase AbiEii toxin, Type IV TA system